MMNMTGLEDQLAQVMNDFILSTGGNLDHRASNNRDRKALIHFLTSCLNIIPKHPYGDIEILKAAQAVVDKQLPQLTLSSQSAGL